MVHSEHLRQAQRRASGVLHLFKGRLPEDQAVRPSVDHSKKLCTGPTQDGGPPANPAYDRKAPTPAVWDEAHCTTWALSVYELFGIIKATEMGVKLFNGIATANPAAKKYHKGTSNAPTFAEGEVNLLVAREHCTARSRTQRRVFLGELLGSGIDTYLGAHVDVVPALKGGGAKALDLTAKFDGTGSESLFTFDMGHYKPNGENPLFIAAHELVHALHHVTGTTDAGSVSCCEELRTVGGLHTELVPQSPNGITENVFRAEYGALIGEPIPLRGDYYPKCSNDADDEKGEIWVGNLDEEGKVASPCKGLSSLQ